MKRSSPRATTGCLLAAWRQQKCRYGQCTGLPLAGCPGKLCRHCWCKWFKIWRAVISKTPLHLLRRLDYDLPFCRHCCAFFNPRPAGGAESAPLRDFLNSKTVADIDAKFCVPYPTSIWHPTTKFCRNRPENFLELDVFVGSLHALNIRNSPKIEF